MQLSEGLKLRLTLRTSSTFLKRFFSCAMDWPMMVARILRRSCSSATLSSGDFCCARAFWLQLSGWSMAAQYILFGSLWTAMKMRRAVAESEISRRVELGRSLWSMMESEMGGWWV